MNYITPANHWQIPLHKARNTVRQTMQQGVQTVLHPTLLRHFRTNTRCVTIRGCPVTSLAMQSSSQRSHQPKATRWHRSLQWTLDRANPMPCKGEANEALGLLLSWEGVPPKMIVDDAKEMQLVDFVWKYKDASCYLQSLEPYSSWSNSTDHEIRKLKKGATRKLTRSGLPLWLWCIELEYKSCNCSHTAHGICHLDGRVPKPVVSGETDDISPFCEFGFWDWVKFQEKRSLFLATHWYLAST